jgi:hypothetical protein
MELTLTIVWDGLDEAIVGMANKAVNGEIIILDGDGERSYN